MASGACLPAGRLAICGVVASGLLISAIDIVHLNSIQFRFVKLPPQGHLDKIDNINQHMCRQNPSQYYLPQSLLFSLFQQIYQVDFPYS